MSLRDPQFPESSASFLAAAKIQPPPVPCDKAADPPLHSCHSPHSTKIAPQSPPAKKLPHGSPPALRPFLCTRCPDTPPPAPLPPPPAPQAPPFSAQVSPPEPAPHAALPDNFPWEPQLSSSLLSTPHFPARGLSPQQQSCSGGFTPPSCSCSGRSLDRPAPLLPARRRRGNGETARR